MNATPFLSKIAKALSVSKLEVVMIGNAAAAIRGSPVTTIDFDFMFRDTPHNRIKLKRFAKALDAIVLRPYYPVSALFRIVNDEIGLQIDIMPRIHGIKSFVSLRSRAEAIDCGGFPILIASLADIIKSKEAADRPRDRASLPVLRRTLAEEEIQSSKAKKKA
jgi:predicted nucleotidyltransferase